MTLGNFAVSGGPGVGCVTGSKNALYDGPPSPSLSALHFDGLGGPSYRQPPAQVPGLNKIVPTEPGDTPGEKWDSAADLRQAP